MVEEGSAPPLDCKISRGSIETGSALLDNILEPLLDDIIEPGDVREFLEPGGP